jgi:hypothetical protein
LCSVVVAILKMIIILSCYYYYSSLWWSYKYMFLVGPKVFSFVIKGVKVIFWGVQRGWGLL